MRGFGSTCAAWIMVALGTCVVIAQGQPPAGQQPAPPQPQGRGIRGPRRRCRSSSRARPRATARTTADSRAPTRIASRWRPRPAQAAVTWHAYLSTQGPNAVNARDRIGNGPWYNARGQLVAQDVARAARRHDRAARLGNALGKQLSLTEKSGIVNGVGDTPNQHDILTGSQPDGRAYTDSADHTCNNWTSNDTGQAQLGHQDRTGGGNTSWNSTHASKGCSQQDIMWHRRGGSALLLRIGEGR